MNICYTATTKANKKQYDLARATLSASITSASDLKHAYECYIEGGYFFTRKAMKFFGDTMRNYGLRRIRASILGQTEPVEVFELYRKQPVQYGLQLSAYFSTETFKKIYIECEA